MPPATPSRRSHRALAVTAALTCLALPSAPALAANWEGAKVAKELFDADTSRPETLVSQAVSATRSGCRVAALLGNILDGFLVRVDGIPGPRFDEIAAATPVFSADGSALAYCAYRDSEWRWVVNGKEGPKFPQLTPTSFAFSPDGKRHAYVGVLGFRRHVLVIDGKVVGDGTSNTNGGVPWDAPPLFSGDGSRLAWTEVDFATNRMRVVVDGEAGRWHEAIALREAPASGAFQLNIAGGAAGGGAPIKQATPLVPAIAFSADGRQVGYVAIEGASWVAIINGSPKARHQAFGFDFLFSPDGKDYAYVARDGDQRFIIRANSRVPIKELHDWTLTFSPDGKRLAFAGRITDRTIIWLDGKPAPCDIDALAFPSNGGSRAIRFSPDSRRIAFLVGDEARRARWVVDGKSGPGEALIATDQFDFSPDSAHFAYSMLRSQSGDIVIVVDGTVRASHPAVPCGPVFLSDGTLEYLAIEDSKLFRFRITGY